MSAALFDAVQTLCRDTFGESILYDRIGFSAVSIQGIFDAAHEEITVQVETGVPVSTVRPIVGIRLADLAITPTAGDFVTARGVLYVVSDVQPDGQGWAVLRLRRS